MGGDGSGRKPDVLKMALEQQKIKPDVPIGEIQGTDIFLPNYSGIQKAVKKGDTGLTPGSVLFAGSSGEITQDNSNFFWDDANNRLGIGTTTPQAKIHIDSTVSLSGIFLSDSDFATGNSGISIRSSDLTANGAATLSFRNHDDEGNTRTAGWIKSGKEQLWTTTSSTRDGFLAFATSLNSADTERMRITSNGNVGIGTTSPSTLLDVSGSITIRELSTPSAVSGSVKLFVSGSDLWALNGFNQTTRLTP